MAARPAAQMATLAARKQRLARQETQKRLVKREKVQLKPHQIIGAEFLAARETALLADQMRVGKTLAAVAAADIILAQNICVVTTSSGRAVWRKAFNEGQALPRTVLVNGVDELRGADVIITSWDTAGHSDQCPRKPLEDLSRGRAWPYTRHRKCNDPSNIPASLAEENFPLPPAV